MLNIKFQSFVLWQKSKKQLWSNKKMKHGQLVQSIYRQLYSSLLTEQNSHTLTSVEALESLCTQCIYNQIILKKIQQQQQKSIKEFSKPPYAQSNCMHKDTALQVQSSLPVATIKLVLNSYATINPAELNRLHQSSMNCTYKLNCLLIFSSNSHISQRNTNS